MNTGPEFQHLDSLVRDCLPAVEEDDLSPSGDQALAVLARVRATTDTNGVFTFRGSRSRYSGSDKPLRSYRHWRAVALAPIGAVAAGILALSLVSSNSVVTPTARQHVGSFPHASTQSSVKAKLLAALNSVGNDVVEVTTTTSSVSANGATGYGPCTERQWMTPVVVAPGSDFRENIVSSACPNQPASGTGVDLVAQTVTPFALFPASNPQALRFPRAAIYICGKGQMISYQSDKGWQSPSEIMRIPDVASPMVIQEGLAMNLFHVIGHTTVGGVPAIALSVPFGRSASQRITDTVFVNSSTYLPIREVLQVGPQVLPAGPVPPPVKESTGVSTQTMDYKFLPSTPANLALVNDSLPSGVTQVPMPAFTGIPVASSCPSTSPAGTSGTSPATNPGA